MRKSFWTESAARKEPVKRAASKQRHRRSKPGGAQKRRGQKQWQKDGRFPEFLFDDIVCAGGSCGFFMSAGVKVFCLFI
jgi:hypothetical protein